MNTTTRFTINFFDKTITGTKASFNKAGKGYGPEYEELTAKMARHPDFQMEVKEQKHKLNRAKRTYEGLDFSFMETYISTLENAKAVKAGYEAVKKMAGECGIKAYGLTKKWFLEKFGTKEDGFDMAVAKERIDQYRINCAKESTAALLSVVPSETANTDTDDVA